MLKDLLGSLIVALIMFTILGVLVGGVFVLYKIVWGIICMFCIGVWCKLLEKLKNLFANIIFTLICITVIIAILIFNYFIIYSFFS